MQPGWFAESTQAVPELGGRSAARVGGGLGTCLGLCHHQVPPPPRAPLTRVLQGWEMLGGDVLIPK